jgi:hypothetical protein
MTATNLATSINPLPSPDGSATYTALGYTIIGSVNGPLEVSRRDELPEEAALEVNIRPAVGVGCTFLLVWYKTTELHTESNILS